VQRKLQIHREASSEKQRWQVQTKQKEILLRQCNLSCDTSCCQDIVVQKSLCGLEEVLDTVKQ